MSKGKRNNGPKPKYKKQPANQAQGNGQSPTKPAPGKPKPIPPANPPDPSPVVTLEPLAPLIVRSGRPFDAFAGVDESRFPPPSTLAGCLRTAWARANNCDFGPELMEQVTVKGPLLLRPGADGQTTLLVPKPADAHYFGHDDQARCVRAVPTAFDNGCGADLPDGLLPVRLTETVQGKPGRGPTWWALKDLIDFRVDQSLSLSLRHLKANGWSPPAGDRRTHVAIDPNTFASETGRLFQTEGLDLEPCNPGLHSQVTSSLRLLACCHKALPQGLVHLGGERRLARLRPEPESVWPTAPEQWFEQIQKAGGLTLTLLTPAHFTAGYRPGWLDDAMTGIPPIATGLSLRLCAVAVARWQAHSGWDLYHKQPRPTRKLVAAGATYWFRFVNHPTQQDLEALQALWLNSICDLEQDRRDGYGLVLPAPWQPPAGD